MDLSRANLFRWGKLIATYFVGQGLTQVLQLVTGFLIVNWLTKDAYATFTLVMAIQATTAILVEIGVSQSLGAFIGNRYDEPEFVGRYIGACRYIRDRLLIFGGAVLLIIFHLIAPRYGWTGGIWIWLWLSVIIALIFQAWGGIYSPLLLLKQDLKTVYVMGVGSGILRLGMIGVVHLFGLLSAPLALLYGALQACYAGWGARELTRSMIQTPAPGTSLREEKRALLGQAIPRVPSTIFFAFEGQVTVFLISVFGSTGSIADLGALGRLAMLFILVRKANGVLISPYFAKLAPERVYSKTAVAVAAAFLFFVFCSSFVYFFPEPFLMVLGDAYKDLKFEVFLIMSVSALNLITMLMFSICLARKYIFPWYSIVDIGPVCIAMIFGFMAMDLSQLTGVLYFSLMMGVVKLFSVAFVLGFGLKREGKPQTDSFTA